MKFLIVEVDDRCEFDFLNKMLVATFPILTTLDSWEIVALTPKKHSVKVVNEIFEKIKYDENYDAVNITFITPLAPRAYKIAEEFKKRGKIVILSGIHASALPEEAIVHADSVIIGAGEDVWLSLIEDLEKNELKKVYKANKPMDPNLIPQMGINYPKSFILVSHVQATRGCPYRCEFCQDSHINNGSIFRARPVDNVIEEIKANPRKNIIFYDSSLTIDVEYTKSLFKKMYGLNKKFLCNGNIEALYKNDELLKIAKKAGCIAWFIGFESVSQKTIDEIGKQTNIVINYKQAVKKIHDNGMAVIGSFIFGFDTDKLDVFEKTLDMIDSCEIDVADFLLLTPFPGTPLYKRLESENRILTKDWSKYSGTHVVFEPKNMTPEELYSGWERTLKEFHHPKRFLKRIFKGLKFGIYPSAVIFFRNLIGRKIQSKDRKCVEKFK